MDRLARRSASGLAAEAHGSDEGTREDLDQDLAMLLREHDGEDGNDGEGGDMARSAGGAARTQGRAGADLQDLALRLRIAVLPAGAARAG